MPDSVVHIAGSWLHVGSRLRQRCAWCGATLIDMDLALTAVPEAMDATPGKWEPGSLVSVYKHQQWAEPHVDGERLPPNACAQIDDEVTR